MNESTARDIPGYLGQLSAAVLACISLPSLAAAQGGTAEPTEEIIVTSSIIAQPRRQIGTAVSAIDFEEIELRGYTDLSDVLRTQTGIGVSNTGGQGKSTSVRIRGEETYRTTLMIDGVKALDPSAPQVSPDFDSLLTTSDLQRVEVLRGPQGFMYGADAGGVVNVITKRGADEIGGRVGVEAGDYSTRKLDAAVSGGSDRGDYFLSVVDLETDGFNSRTDDTVLRDDDGAENTTLHAKLGLNVADDVRLQFVARDIDAEAQYDNCGFPTVHDCVGTTEQTTYKLSADVSGDLFSNSFDRVSSAFHGSICFRNAAAPRWGAVIRSSFQPSSLVFFAITLSRPAICILARPTDSLIITRAHRLSLYGATSIIASAFSGLNAA